jgi:hypothetical protein
MTPRSSRSAHSDGEPTWREVASTLVAGAPQVTDYLRLGTLLMPDNSGSEVTSESVHAVLSLVTLFTDSAEAAQGGAFARHKIEKRGGAAAEGTSETVLETVRRLELLMEMVADRMVGETRKVPLLLAIEFIKTICRIRLTLQGRDLPGRGRRLGLRRSISLICLMRQQLSRSNLRWWMAGSILHALRPLLYLAALQKYGSKSWAPWLLSLLVDIAAEITASRPIFDATTRSAPLRQQPPGPPHRPRRLDETATQDEQPNAQGVQAGEQSMSSGEQSRSSTIDIRRRNSAIDIRRRSSTFNDLFGGGPQAAVTAADAEGGELGEAIGGEGVEGRTGGGDVRSSGGDADGQGGVCVCVCV